VNLATIGEKANATRPEIEQVMFDTGGNEDLEELDRKLYLCRRRIEQAVRAARDAIWTEFDREFTTAQRVFDARLNFIF